MKAEINNENKARFTALYWGQKIGSLEFSDTDQKHDFEINSNHMYFHWINLKPLSAISDEDAIEVAKLNTWQTQSGTHEIYLNHWGQKVIKTAEGPYGYFVIIEPKLNPAQVDFLRSRGYALSWMGLSVEELIAAGWVKLKE